MKPISIKFKKLINMANKQQTVNIINKVSSHLYFPLFNINEDDDVTTITYLKYHLYEAPSREIFVIRYDNAPSCYLLSTVKFSTKTYIVALQKPVRYLKYVKSLEEVTL